MPGAYALPEAGSLFFLSFWASGRPNSPFSPRRRRELLTGVDVLASPCMPSFVSGIRTPRILLLPLREKGVGGMLTGVDFLASPCVPSFV